MLRKNILFLVVFLTLFVTNVFADENTDQAWQAFSNKDYKKAKVFTQKCLDKAKDKALRQQRDLDGFKIKNRDNYRALSMGVVSPEEDKDVPGRSTIEANKELNDTATAHFIEAEMFAAEGKKDPARKKYAEIINNYKDAFCWDPRGWFWRVSDVAQDKMDNLGTPYDYEDYKSETLTKKAWDCLKAKDHKGVELYAEKCIYLFEKKARDMHAKLKAKPRKGEESLTWAVNDVAVSYFLLGEKHRAEGNKELAKQMYAKVKEFPFAVCWDPQGWHWEVEIAINNGCTTTSPKSLKWSTISCISPFFSNK